MEITNRVFTKALLNPASEEYQTLFKEVSKLVRTDNNDDDDDDYSHSNITAIGVLLLQLRTSRSLNHEGFKSELTLLKQNQYVTEYICTRSPQ